MIAKAVILRAFGGAETLRCETVEVSNPGRGELLVHQTAIGVNFHDIYVRSGQYRTLSLPGTPGIEAAGIVEGCGPEVTEFAEGDRIVYLSSAYGAYASRRTLPASLAVKLPDDMTDSVAAAMFVRGLTVIMLAQRILQLGGGHTVLVHAAAGGVGRLLTQYASRLGARVIGTVGSVEKARIAQTAGCADTILYREENFVDRVLELTRGRGVDVVYDSVGKDTVAGSFRSLRPCGHLVAFGQSSGPADPIEFSLLAQRSTTVTRPILFHYVAERSSLDAMSARFFDALHSGWITPPEIVSLPLEDAAVAHRLLEERATQAAVVLSS